LSNASIINYVTLQMDCAADAAAATAAAGAAAAPL
jgi:hypothetical protein